MRKLLYNNNCIEKPTYEECIKKLLDETSSTVNDWFFMIKANECMYVTHISRTRSEHQNKSKDNTNLEILVLDTVNGDRTFSIEEKPKPKKRGRPRKKKVKVEEKTNE